MLSLKIFTFYFLDGWALYWVMGFGAIPANELNLLEPVHHHLNLVTNHLFDTFNLQAIEYKTGAPHSQR